MSNLAYNADVDKDFSSVEVNPVLLNKDGVKK